MPVADIQYRLRRHEEKLSKVQSQIGSNTRIRELRDDPMAAAHAVRFASYLARLERYEKNTQFAMEHYNTMDSYLQEFTGILQRVRELAVNGANGTNGPEELKYIAIEVNELLKEMVAIANKTGPDGKQMFAGDKAFTEPFRIVEGGGESMVVRVEYRGAGANRSTQISDGTYTTLDIGGGEAFWAEKMNIVSRFDAVNYRVTENSSIFVDNVEIKLSQGDTLHTIVAKINDSTAPVKAYVDPETRGLALSGTNAHLVRLEDQQGFSTLQDLGIIKPTGDPAAPNWHETALVSGGSAFDMVIRLRDALFRGDQDFTGSQGIGGVDLALSNIANQLTVEGSRHERSRITWARIGAEKETAVASLAREESVDYIRAATDLANIDFAYKAALQTAAKIIPTTLLDFLR
jgi:flagellar hook-associated protein 3 FlgL